MEPDSRSFRTLPSVFLLNLSDGRRENVSAVLEIGDDWAIIELT